MKAQRLFLFQALEALILEIKTVAFQFLIHMAVMENGLAFTPLTKMQPMEPYFAHLIHLDNQTRLIAISKILMETLLMNLL